MAAGHTPETDRFVRRQRDYYEHADPGHFTWQTEAPYFAATEADLVADLPLVPEGRLLEIGCGEGVNLHHLRDLPGRRFGVDFSPEKVAFAHQQTGSATSAADAAALPFADHTFDAVLIRDLLHHVPDRARVVAEAYRVLKPGARLVVIEPNGFSPLVLLQATMVAAERGLYRSHSARIRSELGGAGFVIDRETRLQPLPLARIVLHPRLGTARLGRLAVVRRALDAADSLARRVLPRQTWLYLKFEAHRPAGHRA
jgi:SAM-dependent methyltransferase